MEQGKARGHAIKMRLGHTETFHPDTEARLIREGLLTRETPKISEDDSAPDVIGLPAHRRSDDIYFSRPVLIAQAWL